MTLLDQPLNQQQNQMSPGQRGSQPGPSAQAEQNVGGSERAVSIAAGSILTVLGLSRKSVPGLLIAGVGGSLIYRGATGHCSMYQSFGINTAKTPAEQQQDIAEEISERGIHVEQVFLINKPAEELYRYWRNFENLPNFMSHVKELKVLDDRRSHWVVDAPRIAGGKVEWDAEITQDEPASRIAWQSLPGADVDHRGEIRFAKALGDRGTEVHVFMDYVPPAGRLGHWLATIFGESPRRQMRDDLRNFKRLMEMGEIPTIEGQPRGTCTGRGSRS